MCGLPAAAAQRRKRGIVVTFRDRENPAAPSPEGPLMPSRRELIELSPEEIGRFLIEQKTVVIVSNGKNGYPHPMPMWFYADAEGCVYCTTFRKSQKVINFQNDPRASLLVESGEEYTELKSVLIYARAEVIDDLDAVVDTLVKITIKGRSVAEQDLQRIGAGVRKTAEKRVVLKFVPERYVSWDHAKLGGRY
jgi:nitroimidazol reductase NimA-like FMN-containing flavoprotein (pyridoxamine 5'-phosphate oxidase superfamily)